MQNGRTSLLPTLPLKKQEQSELMAELCKALSRIVKIYQIPNIDNEALVYLSEFIMEEYQHNDLALIQEALKYPPRNSDNTWRMTPDTIRFWVDQTREKVFDRTAKEESRKRQEAENPKHTFSPETEKMIQDYKNMLLDGIRTVPQMDESEIKANGQIRPKAVNMPSTDDSYVRDWIQRMRGHQERTYRERHPGCTDQEVERFLNNC
jgi:hypothetical protein